MAINKKGKHTKTPTPQNKNTKKKMTKRSIVNAICIVFLSLCVIGSSIAFVLVQNILSKSEVMEKLDGLYSESSTEIYDLDGNVITTLANTDGVRENIAYEDIPQVVIDAFLSIEDSRYFKHSGFDLPRFIKSGWVNVISGGIAQGGSTLTMQLVDVKLFPDASGNDSLVQKLEQKVVEIFKSMDIEARLDKEQILEYYLNSINFGGPARGIQKGAQYYFGKDAKNLNLTEAAFLAGVINAPGSYNPYYANTNPEIKTYLQRASERRNQVLYQMNNHGYISDDEYKLALSTDLSLQLNGETAFSTDSYASIIKVVVDETREKTGKDPYTTPMKIYTTISKESQELADKILNGEVVNFPNERIQTGFTLMDNQTGAILAIGGGRGYSLDSQYNHGYYFDHQIGSTAKPIVEYAAAFEDLGYSTEQTFEDTPIDNYANGETLYNADRK
ncbi:MAG: penicillin-binding protein, partial [Erysipelotrichia bacterium]|nr:penicillin-binding protein [Erysipelotrichia bacterium]